MSTLMRRFLSPCLALLLAGLCLAAPRSAAARPVESAPVSIKDDRGGRITLLVPLPIHRGANHFRLYGPRPLTLHSRDRRRDLYREALLDHATQASLAPRTTAWDDLRTQVEWLRETSGTSSLPVLPSLPGAELNRAIAEWTRKARSLPGYGHLESLGKAFGHVSPQVDLPDTLMATLQLRALATDEAERRLTALGRALRLEDAAVDPALREAFATAVAEFQTVRRDLWTALANGLQKHQGRLLLSAVREMLLSPLGAWAVFGHLGWKGVESAFGAEHRGQLAICSATLARRIEEAAARNSGQYGRLKLYADYALAYQLTEALRQDGVLALKPAGGRSAGAWTLELAGQVTELKKALAPEPS